MPGTKGRAGWRTPRHPSRGPRDSPVGRVADGDRVQADPHTVLYETTILNPRRDSHGHLTYKSLAYTWLYSKYAIQKKNIYIYISTLDA